jgi:hypothetical protein
MIDMKEKLAKELKAQGKSYGSCPCGLLNYFGESARHSLSHAPSCSEHHSRYRVDGQKASEFIPKPV